jgi:hypothetical protein
VKRSLYRRAVGCDYEATKIFMPANREKPVIVPYIEQQPDDKAGLDPGPTLVAVERRNLVIDPVPVDLAGELHQLIPHVDDLVEPPRNRSPSPVVCGFFGRIATSAPMRRRNHDSRLRGIPKTNLQASVASTLESLQSQKRSIRKNRLTLKGFGRFLRTTRRSITLN